MAASRYPLVLTDHERAMLEDTWPLDLITSNERQPLEVFTPTAFAAQVRFLRTAAQLRLRPPAPDEFAYGTVSNGEGAIHEDALPLARRGACGVALSVPAAGVVLAAQLWALAGVLSVDGQRRNDRLARACLCILSLETVAVAASIVLRGRRGFSTDDRQNGGELGATLHCLSWLSLALGVRRLRASAAFPPAGAVDAFAPLWCAEALLVAALLHLYLRHRTGVYKLEQDQLAGALLDVHHGNQQSTGLRPFLRERRFRHA